MALTQGRPTKTLVIVEENHTASEAFRAMPYLSSLAHTYGYMSNDHALTHPSLPNYIGILSGTTAGIRDDANPALHPLHGESAFDRAARYGHPAKIYAEGQPRACAQANSGRYAVRHNPWAYFADPGERAACLKDDVASGTTAGGALRHDIDAGALPQIGMLIPDVCHDGHDCSLGTADTWLKSWLPRIMAGPDYRAGRLSVIVTFDEDDSVGNNTVLTTVISPYTSHIVSSTSFNHYSLTRYFGEITGMTLLRGAASAPSLRAAFHI